MVYLLSPHINHITIAGFLCFLASVLLFILKADVILNPPWILLSLPLLLTIFLTTLRAKLILEIRWRYDLTIRSQISKPLYVFSLSLGLFAFLCCMRLDEFIRVNWAIVFIPFWLATGIYLIIVLHSLKHLFRADVNMQREGVTLVLYFLAAVSSSVMFVGYIELSSPPFVCEVLSPVLIVGLLHYTTYLGSRIIAKKLGNPKPVLTNEFKFIVSILPTTAIICMKFMVFDFIPTYIICVVASKSVVMWFIEQETTYIKNKKSYENLG